MKSDLHKEKYQVPKKSHVSSPIFNVIFFFKGENTSKKTLQRLCALKYGTQGMVLMELPISPHNSTLLSNCPIFWTLGAQKNKGNKVQVPYVPASWETRKTGDERRGSHEGLTGASGWSPIGKYPMEAFGVTHAVHQVSSPQGFRAWISRWMRLHDSPLQYIFQDPILPGLLPLAVLTWAFLWKEPYESKGWVWYGVGNVCAKMGKCSDEW